MGGADAQAMIDGSAMPTTARVIAVEDDDERAPEQHER
jgi:hypothetical protein